MEKREKRKIVISLIAFLFLTTLLLGISIYSYFFFKELDIDENGFLDISILEKLGFWDERPNRYYGYWYSNGHLHPFYVLTTILFENCYIYNIIFSVIVILYVLIKSRFKKNISYSKLISVLAFISFIINIFIFFFAMYYYISAEKVFPTDINFYIFLGNVIVYLSILMFYFSHKKKPLN